MDVDGEQADRFEDIVRFVGSRADTDEIKAIIGAPSTRPTWRGDPRALGDIESVRAMASRYDAFKAGLNELLSFHDKTVLFRIPR
ncbi:MAG: hypothetical protein OSB69_23675 [Alphaproteobacteria bacterium]|nr:hypothetical protein [Alphaproteobacteria bacterium]